MYSEKGPDQKFKALKAAAAWCTACPVSSTQTDHGVSCILTNKPLQI